MRSFETLTVTLTRMKDPLLHPLLAPFAHQNALLRDREQLKHLIETRSKTDTDEKQQAS